MDASDDVVDVPIDNEHDQLPSVEEARMHAHDASATFNAHNGAEKKRRLLLASILVGLALVGLIVGLAVGLSGTENSNVASVSGTDQGKPTSPPSGQQPVSTPTSRPFTVRAEKIISYLLENELSGFSDVRTPGTPQYRAIHFLANEDGMAMDIPDPDVSTADAFEFLERYAVSVFYYALGVMNLVSSGSTCEWYHTFHNMGGHSTNIGVICNGQRQVQEIFTPNLNLQGTLPSELHLLTKLAMLVISDNRDVHGTIPDALHKLTELKYFDLSSNNLTGEIPSWIVKLTALEFLALSDNDLTGPLPDSMASLSNLALLALDGNGLTGNIHTLESNTMLRFLYLERNQFVQTIRNTTLKDLSRLEHLDLSDNKFHGDSGIPRHFFEIPNLEVLDLTDNRIKGKLPEDIPTNKDMRSLFLHGNELSGSIPLSIQNLSSLNHLDLAQNKFSGTIPRGIGNLSTLVYLFLAVNDFDNGPIPDWVEKLTFLRDLSFKDTQRTGTIPTYLGTLSNLILLDLDRNALQGSIPSQLANLENVSFLLLNRNQLTGTVPTEFASLDKLGKCHILVVRALLLFSQYYLTFHSIDMLLMENNTITGDVSLLCSSNDILEFVADCGGATPEVSCPLDCCTTCCSDDQTCNDDALLATFDPIWEHSYNRPNVYDFGGNASFPA